ncbi:hypothetical protein FIBSPDRAFT_873606 [Athelia psychrophila]|uniref:Uncharacterized protein n=1 Tax=Athelia psychrophila TaxID=1759441 RepID=A0A165YDD9_9AGAM|nr:hypothetical protein FIBSPDRAFT_873605 [Fibularhizoctonia sp. CBS 109695]KZP09450.1 hypothetical protein FIBSPDRAFT_873606 [Fibularhizoctonia sp. CBS 109695]
MTRQVLNSTPFDEQPPATSRGHHMMTVDTAYTLNACGVVVVAFLGELCNAI